MLRLAFDFIITWRETRTRPNAYNLITCPIFNIYWIKIAIFGAVYIKPYANIEQCSK